MHLTYVRGALLALLADLLLSAQVAGMPAQRSLERRDYGVSSSPMQSGQGTARPKKMSSIKSLNPFGRSKSGGGQKARFSAQQQSGSPARHSSDDFTFHTPSRHTSPHRDSAPSSPGSPSGLQSTSGSLRGLQGSPKLEKSRAFNIHANGVSSAPQSPRTSPMASPYANHRTTVSAPASPAHDPVKIKSVTPSQRQRIEAVDHLKLAAKATAHGAARLIGGVPIGVAGAISSLGGSAVSAATGKFHRAGEQLKDAPLKILHGAGFAAVGGGHALTEGAFNICSATSCGIRAASAALKGKNKRLRGETDADMNERLREQGRRVKNTKDTVDEWSGDLSHRTKKHFGAILSPKPYHETIESH